MKLITTTAVLGCIAVTVSASIVDTVKDTAQAAIGKFITPNPAVTFPCCVSPCAHCPTAMVLPDGNRTVSITFNRPNLFVGHPPGCGQGFSTEDCVRFFQVVLADLNQPLEVAARKATHDRDDKDKLGCGADNTAGECLEYLKGFFESLKEPIQTTLGDASLLQGKDSEAAAGAEASESGKSEL